MVQGRIYLVLFNHSELYLTSPALVSSRERVIAMFRGGLLHYCYEMYSAVIDSGVAKSYN